MDGDRVLGRESSAGQEGFRSGHSDAESAMAAVVRRCTAELSAGGTLAALRYLNSRTRFRYTGIYHAEPPMLRNVDLFDRENPRVNVSGDVKPLDETYCGIICGTNARFATGDALGDARLSGHAARETVLSYSGAPIRLANGEACGSLCHFDTRPRLLSAEEMRVLEAIAPLFARCLDDV